MKMKKVFWVLLIVSVLFVAFAASVFAENIMIEVPYEVKFNKVEVGDSLADAFSFADKENGLLTVPDGANYTAELKSIEYGGSYYIYRSDKASYGFEYVESCKVEANIAYTIRVCFQANDGYKLDIDTLYNNNKLPNAMKVTGLEVGKGKDIELLGVSGHVKDKSIEINFVISKGMSFRSLGTDLTPKIGEALTYKLGGYYFDAGYFISGAPYPYEYELLVAPIGTEISYSNAFGKSECTIQITAVNSMDGGTMYIRAKAADGQTVDIPIGVAAVTGGHTHTWAKKYGHDKIDILPGGYHGKTTCTDPDCPGVCPELDAGSEYEKHAFAKGCTVYCHKCGLRDEENGTHTYVWAQDKEYNYRHVKTCGCGKVDASTYGDHTGGYRTCVAKAKCEVCNLEYGQIGKHQYAFETEGYGNVHFYRCTYCKEEDADKRHTTVETGEVPTCGHRNVCGYEGCNVEYGDYVNHKFDINTKCTECGKKKYIDTIVFSVPTPVPYTDIKNLSYPIVENGEVYAPNAAWMSYSSLGANPDMLVFSHNVVATYVFYPKANCKFETSVNNIAILVRQNGELLGKKLRDDGGLEVAVLIRHPKNVQSVHIKIEQPRVGMTPAELSVTEESGLEVSLKIDEKYLVDGKFCYSFPIPATVTVKAPEDMIFPMPYERDMFLCDVALDLIGGQFVEPCYMKENDDRTELTFEIYMPPVIAKATNYGDVNGDGVINSSDSVLLSQHLAGWSVDIDTDAADVNGDGTVNSSDSVLLSQYLAGWDVKLGK